MGTTAHPDHFVRVRETGAKRHTLVASNGLTRSKLYAIALDHDAAVDYARWLLANNDGPDGFDSAQVVHAVTGRVEMVAA